MLDECELPFAPPLFDLFLSADRVIYVGVMFEPDERSDIMLVREAFDVSVFVFPHSPYEIIAHADVKRAVSLGRENISEVVMFSHSRTIHEQT